MFKKECTIRVDGIRCERWMVKDIIGMFVKDHIYAVPQEITLGNAEDGFETHYIDVVNYDFQASRKTFKRIVKELKRRELDIYPCMKANWCTVVF